MTTIFITNPQPQLVTELANERPSWEIVPLDGVLPNQFAGGGFWAFIDWDTSWLPAMEVCQALRRLDSSGRLSITMFLNERQLEANRRLLQAAALDWLLSPIDALEIVRKVERFTLANRPSARRLTCGDLMVDPGAHLVRAKGSIVPLGPSEFSLLVHFMENRGRIYSRTELMSVLGKKEGEIEQRTIDIWIGRIRRKIINKLNKDIFRTVRSEGYIMDSEYSKMMAPDLLD